MISDLAWLFGAVLEVFRIEFTIYGFTFSLWQVFCFDVVAAIIGWILGKVFLDD
ncbi:MAG: hypothetical protein HFF70_14620 [Oscillospiraceae bacterium]|jgi:hypothetical protein|nr:hypothetical protein [Oscillospiraceae bacterium]